MTQNVRPSFDQILESVVILSWVDLLPYHRSGSIHVEYVFGAEGNISTLKLWLSTVRGRWRLLCGVETKINSCLQFEDCCKSGDLSSNLEFILRYQAAFPPPQNFGRAGLLQIKDPTQNEIATAVDIVKTARSFVDSFWTQPATA
jgi:hypothetical protein